MLVFQKYSNDISYEEAVGAIEEDEEELSLDDFSRSIIELTFTHLDEIDAVIEPNLKKWTLKRIPKVSLAALRISCAQLMFMKDIPDSVVINEAVELAKEFGTDDEYSFVNGALRNINLSLKGEA
ncbi:MAG: transcription antitermination factor NusB [Ruminococcaceae bacterium]|nr:transcription antitermination factor NusB [Oscillospiraceae bacterium]